MASDLLSPEKFSLAPDAITVPEASRQAMTKAIRSAILPKKLEKVEPHGKSPFAQNLFAPNLLARQLARQVPNVCSVPLVEVPIPKFSGAVIGRAAPQEEFDAMPKAEMPAPPCRNWNSRHK